MYQAPTAPVQSAPPPREISPKAVQAKPSRSANLLQIVRALIDVGRQRLAAMRSHPGPEETHELACAFGTFNVALIVARILRGLRIAAALEQRVIAVAPRLDTPTQPRATAIRSAPRSPRKPKLSQAENDGLMPTDQEIAEMIRHRPIGAVLVDICADLGIGAGHPLWHELLKIVVENDGNPMSILLRTSRHIFNAHLHTAEFYAPDFVFPSESQQICHTTGPPPRTLAT